MGIKNEVVLIDRHTIKLIELNVNQRNTHLYQMVICVKESVEYHR